MGLFSFLENVGRDIVEMREKEFGTHGIESTNARMFRILYEQDQKEKEEAAKLGILHPNEHIVHVVVHHKYDQK